jgi:hypothetical protein
MLSSGDLVPTPDALQLRTWASIPEDAVLSLEAIALLILSEEDNPTQTTSISSK